MVVELTFVLFALQASVILTVFGFGLKTKPSDLAALIRHPSLLARALVAMFVIMPAVAILLARLFDFRPEVEIVMIALSISPVPPLLPQKQAQTGSRTQLSLGLLAIVSLLAIVIVPLEGGVLDRVVGRLLATPAEVSRVLMLSILLPLTAGMTLAAAMPRLAEPLETLITRLAIVLLPLAALALVVVAAPAMWALIGDGTIIAMALFVVTGLALGQAMGGADPNHTLVLALSTAYRHPGVALSIASANFPDQRFGAVIVLYLVVGAIVGLPYLMWRRHEHRRLQTGRHSDQPKTSVP